MNGTLKHIFAALGAIVALAAVLVLVVKFFDEISEFFNGLKEKCPVCGHDEFNDYVDEEDIV